MGDPVFPSGCVKFEEPRRPRTVNGQRPRDGFGGCREELSLGVQFGDPKSMGDTKAWAAEEPRKGSTEGERPRREGGGTPAGKKPLPCHS